MEPVGGDKVRAIGAWSPFSVLWVQLETWVLVGGALMVNSPAPLLRLPASLLILALGRSSHQFHLPTPPLRTTISSCGPADVDECEDPQSSCLGGECKNTAA